MLTFIGLALTVWITAIFVAGWVDGLRTGVASLVGPYGQVRRQNSPFSYAVAMALLFIPAAVGVIASVSVFKMAFSLQWIPEPPAKGYAAASSALAGGYFPAGMTRQTFKCAEHRKANPILSPLKVDWYSRQLAAAGERSLVSMAAGEKSAENVYRFTWLRSFDKPVFIRIQEIAPGAFQMTASRLSGTGGYEPGTVEVRIERKLSDAEAKRFLRALAAANRLRLKAVDCRRGYDGAEWIF